MGSPPKFNIKKVKKRKEEGSPRQKERDELLRSKEARMAAIRRANNIRRSVRNQIVAQLVATPASPSSLDAPPPPQIRFTSTKVRAKTPASTASPSFERHGRMEQMLIDVIEERLARPHEERRDSSVKV